MKQPSGNNTEDGASPCDFLVLGGGASGCVVARRLSDAGFSVTLVEAGVDPLAPEGRTQLREACLDPLRAAELWGSGGWMAAGGTSDALQETDMDRVDYAFQTEPEPLLGGRRVPLSAGRALGGGTAINNGLYGVTWAQPNLNPWKEWASTPFDLAAWQPQLLAPCVERAAAMLAPQLPPETQRLQAFDQALAMLGDVDGTVGEATRVAWCIDAQGQRVTAASAYLGAASKGAASRPLLRVLPRARVISLDLTVTEAGNDKLTCHGALVEMRDAEMVGAQSQRILLQANREVIVCCGPLLSPVLLLRSGIGPAEELAEASIPVRVASPHVGRNLITQPTLPLRPAAGKVPAVGPSLQPVAPAKAPLGRGLECALFAWPQLGLLYALGLNTPAARGDVRLPASEAGDVGADVPPRIRLGILDHPRDVERMVWGLGRVQALATYPALREQFGGLEPEWPPGAETLADGGTASMDSFSFDTACVQWLRDRVSSTRHPLGTCRMGQAVSDGVCDERGRVFSDGGGVVAGLRVADNSLAPSPPPDSHVMRMALAIGERVAELTLEDHALSSDRSSAL